MNAEHGVFWASVAASSLVENAVEVGRELRRQAPDPRMLGADAGRMLRWALELVDAGAHPASVRRLLELGIGGRHG